MQERWIQFIKEQTMTPYIKMECSDEISREVCDFLRTIPNKVGYVLHVEGLYDEQSVGGYLKFFARLHQAKQRYAYVMKMMQLEKLRYEKIRNLQLSEKKRVCIAREMLKDPEIFFLQEPINDVDENTCHIIMSWLDDLANQGKRVLMTSRSLKQLYLLPGITYYVTPQDIQLIEREEEAMTQELQNQRLEKISAKYQDKILLFNPNDIDFFESLEGKCYVHVRTSAFLCSSTLDELEVKLKRYGFYRSHRSYLVNMQKVSEVIRWTRNSYSLKLENREDVKIPLSKGRIEEMKEMYHF